MPAVARLRRAYPGAQIDWLIERSAAKILAHARHVDRVIEVDTFRWRRSALCPSTWREIRDQVSQLASTGYDVVLDLQGLWKSAVMGWLTRPRMLMGWDRRFLREPLAAVFYSHRARRENRIVHVILEHLKLVDALFKLSPPTENTLETATINSSIFEFDELASNEDRTWVDTQLRSHRLSDFVIVNPGANWKSKLWPVENYSLLARRIHQELGFSIVVTFGPGEASLAERVSSSGSEEGVVSFPTTLAQLAALAGRAALFVGADTGPLHMAAACGTPIVGIYAPTDPRRNGPFSSEDEVVHQNRCGAYCHRRDCGPRRCIEMITVDSVYKAVRKRLATPRGNPQHFVIHSTMA